jgi:hypothetical protein
VTFRGWAINFPSPYTVQMNLPNPSASGTHPARTRWGSISPILPIVVILEVAIFGLLLFTQIGGWPFLILSAGILLIGVGFILGGPWFYIPRDLSLTEEALTIRMGRKSLIVPWQNVMRPIYRYGPFGGVLGVRLTEGTLRNPRGTFGCGLTRDQYTVLVQWMRTHELTGSTV